MSEWFDSEACAIWRKVGLPEYFLDNSGTNYKLVELIKETRYSDPERYRLMQEVRALRAALGERSRAEPVGSPMSGACSCAPTGVREVGY